MNSNTAGHIRKLKDPSTGLFLWQPTLQMGHPDSLLGYPVAIWEQMDDIGNGKFPVAFGNFRRGYMLLDRTDLRILVDPYSEPGFRRFYVRRRVYGHPSNTDSIKFIRTTT
jgi:HK97 family phage major capsid protein